MARSKRIGRKLLRAVCYLLRHQTETAILPRDSEGFVTTRDLHRALVQRPENAHPFNVDEVRQLLARHSDRFEVVEDRVRARYGHSLEGTEVGAPTIPPPRLYHGTCERWREAINLLGLRPMGRRYVHLTSDLDYARSIALKAQVAPLIVRVEAARAQEQGIKFWRASRHVWLVEFVAPAFLDFETEPAVERYWREVDDRLMELGTNVAATATGADCDRWYHVCLACTAKWFAAWQQGNCPRCGRPSSATDQRIPPWAGCSRKVRMPPSA